MPSINRSPKLNTQKLQKRKAHGNNFGLFEYLRKTCKARTLPILCIRSLPILCVAFLMFVSFACFMYTSSLLEGLLLLFAWMPPCGCCTDPTVGGCGCCCPWSVCLRRVVVIPPQRMFRPGFVAGCRGAPPSVSAFGRRPVRVGVFAVL